ncbi:hypothetical protein [Paenibacillus lautus]|uniref:hypothetical protein n=1 Tax=Paenibacillus lautus TaxID=1401 RepID=UPI003D2E22A5
MSKQNLRDLIYVNGKEQHNQCFYSYGIEFYEFMSCVHNRPENLVLLKHKFEGTQWNNQSRLDYVTSEEVDHLIADYVYDYGDFCWVDFETGDTLDKLTKLQIAELLTFAHLSEPLHEIPKARFAYYAHDDGWFNKLYVSDLEDYKILLSRVIVSKLHRLTRRIMENIPDDIAALLLESTKEGLFIDFSKIVKSRASISVPVTTVGHYLDMDKVYEFRDEITEYKVWLTYSNRKWSFAKAS